ncbi:MAG: tetratricopeptide repeat protein [Desulfobacteraceae bacterium]|nr:tetratricopeptide repeat protein [Desulfobacteraceae bacterium]
MKKEAKYSSAQMLKGEILAMKGKFDDAIAMFDQIIKENPKADRPYYFRAFSRMEKGR